MTIRNFLCATSLIFALVGCNPDEGNEGAPASWFHKSNIHNASTLYMRSNSLKMITSSGISEMVTIVDSEGNPSPDFHLQGGCEGGVEFLGKLYSWEAGGNILSIVNPETGVITSVSANNLTNSPCLHSKATRQVHNWKGRTFFEYSASPDERLSLVEVVVTENTLKLAKVFEFSNNLEELKVIGEDWFFQLSQNSYYPEPYTYSLKLTDFSGSNHFEETVSLAFVVDMDAPKIILVKDDSFELLEFNENEWTSKPLASSANLQKLAKFNFQPSSNTMVTGDNRSILGVDSQSYQDDTIELYELVGEELMVLGELDVGIVIDFKAFGSEVIFVVQEENDGDFAIVSYNIDSKKQFSQKIDTDHNYSRPNYFFSGNGLLYSQKVFNSDGITIKSYDLKQVSNLDLGLPNSSTSTLDSFFPSDVNYYDPNAYYSFFQIN